MVKDGSWCPACRMDKQNKRVKAAKVCPPVIGASPFAPEDGSGLECPACKHHALAESTVIVRDDVVVVRRCKHCGFRERI